MGKYVKHLRLLWALLRYKPRRALYRIAIDFERLCGISLARLFAGRRAVRRFELAQLDIAAPCSLRLYGNYPLPKTAQLGKNSIIYSLGVGQNIAFDEALIDAHRCPIYLFDPTPASARWMQTQTNDKLHFHPYAVYSEDTTLALYADHDADVSQSASFSVHQRSPFKQSIQVPAYTVASLMQKLGHAHLDVIKLDIEGCAPAVLLKMLEDNITPACIVCELEAPHYYGSLQAYFGNLEVLFEALRKHGYQLQSITNRYLGTRIELLAQRAAQSAEGAKGAQA